ncbi:MAG: ABC transporter permease [Chloroflexota bacterium]
MEGSRLDPAYTWDLYRRLVGIRLRSQMQYKRSFVLQIVASFLSTLMELAEVLIFFSFVPRIGGWRMGEVALLYAMASISFGLCDMVGAGIDAFAGMLRRGEVDRLMARPCGPFLQVLAADFQLRRLGRVAQGVVALALAQVAAPLHWSLPKVLFFPLAIASGTVVFLAVVTVGAAACFWTVETTEIQNIVTYGGVYMSTYPLPIYRVWIRRLFTYVVPLAFVTYYPALYLLDRPDPLGLPPFCRFLSPALALAACVVAAIAWRAGLRRYTGTGS